MKLRGLNSNSSSSTASATEATGAAKVADMPAAAPATSSVLRSALVKWKNCAISEPIAPPVMMIGPSAPNGPPDPIEIADDNGFRRATFGSTRDPLMRIASMASGMPWPRMRSDPYRAMAPMISAPTTGTRMTNGPRWWPSGDTRSVENRWKKNKLVHKPINFSSHVATTAAQRPMPTARAEIEISRGVAVKSPRWWRESGTDDLDSDIDEGSEQPELRGGVPF